ncbi:MAG: alginate lyase-domain-containing protein [Piptocephalis tieghemiana]|nr:MAG: alginate lyase-domain-containing protein [Piptocephalis tieghemiana]
MKLLATLALMVACQSLDASPVLQKRFIELDVVLTVIPNSYFPDMFPWQHQNNAYLSANAASGVLKSSPEAANALSDVTKRSHAAPLFTITNATVTPPSGDKRDFLSYAPYWWPNPLDPTGPWIQKDGVINPDILQLTQQADLTAATNAMRSEVLGQVFRGQGSKGYDHVVDQLRAWLVNPKTRMNPNAKYGQVVRNNNPSTWIGRFEAILSVRQLAFVPSVVELVRAHSKKWNKKSDDAAVIKWAQEYLDWLINPPFTPGASTNVNNHRTYWSCQVVEYQRFLGKHADAAKTLATFVNTYLPQQVNATGGMPLEMARTRPHHYGVFNLDALVYLASFAEQIRPDTHKPYYDFWSAQGNAIKKAMDFLIKTFTLDEIELQDVDVLLRLVPTIAARYGDSDGTYAAFVKSLNMRYQEISHALSPLFAKPSRNNGYTQ